MNMLAIADDSLVLRSHEALLKMLENWCVFLPFKVGGFCQPDIWQVKILAASKNPNL